MPSPAERLRSHVRVDEMSGCWIWTGARSGRGWDEGRGYSAFYLYGRRISGHRASYVIFKGEIPDGLTIDHLCRNTLCVNPDHLEAVTNAENIRRGDGWGGRNAKATSCPQGHPFDDVNTSIDSRGGRRCKACNRAAVARHRERQRVGR